MPRTFWRTTAEAVVAAVEAAYTYRRPITQEEAAQFSDSSPSQALAGLSLAVDIGLLRSAGTSYSDNHILCRSLAAAGQTRKAASFRLILDRYEPYRLFLERVEATGDAAQAARQVKTVLDLDLHAEEVKETLLSLAQYAQSLVAQGGGEYHVLAQPPAFEFEVLSKACAEDAAFEARIRRELGEFSAQYVDRDAVIVALADSLSRAAAGDTREAVVHAGNAFESFLVGLAADPAVTVNLSGAHGINSKISRLKQASKITSKIEDVCKWLGAIRNAADHGIDPDVGHPWEIGNRTADLYPYVVCNTIRIIHEYVIRTTRPPEI